MIAVIATIGAASAAVLAGCWLVRRSRYRRTMPHDPARTFGPSPSARNDAFARRPESTQPQPRQATVDADEADDLADDLLILAAAAAAGHGGGERPIIGSGGTFSGAGATSGWDDATTAADARSEPSHQSADDARQDAEQDEEEDREEGSDNDDDDDENSGDD